MPEDLTREQMIAELRESEEKICRHFERLVQMVEVHCELMQQHLEATTEFWKGVLRWFEEREQRLAKSSPLAK
jgi:hypothetical protein